LVYDLYISNSIGLTQQNTEPLEGTFS